ncbi:MAG TPA: addiction module protein, partial [Blastocatellia bacterium]|nr:addiction module protein [Blastocatellia bacterium]
KKGRPVVKKGVAVRDRPNVRPLLTLGDAASPFDRPNLWSTIQGMSSTFEELEEQARALSLDEKAALARILIAELDSAADPNAEQMWVEEAQRRYEAFKAGELQALPGDESA